MNKMFPTVQALARRTSIYIYIYIYIYMHTHIHKDGTAKQTFSESGVPETCKPVKICRIVSLTTAILSHIH
jgi:hypothetical protein